MLDAVSESENARTSDHTSARKQRIEIITRGERRRRWTPEQGDDRRSPREVARRVTSLTVASTAPD